MASGSGYIGSLLKSLFATQASRRPGAPLAPLLSVIVLATTAFNLPGRSPAEEPVIGDSTVEALRQRTIRVRAMLAGAERIYERDVAPLERVLMTYRADQALARRIAVSLVREGAHTGLEPRLLMAVLLVENPWLDPEAVSPVGARGLMQVMPVHRGSWRACGPSLDGVEANICYGARIFAMYMKESQNNLDRALLRYNGCVRGTNTPNCHFYPQHVYARAGRASLLAWRRPLPDAGTP